MWDQGEGGSDSSGWDSFWRKRFGSRLGRRRFWLLSAPVVAVTCLIARIETADGIIDSISASIYSLSLFLDQRLMGGS